MVKLEFILDIIFHFNIRTSLFMFDEINPIPYGGKLRRAKTLAKWQEKHHWWNKLWRIDDESLNKRILKQFEGISALNLSIRTRFFASLASPTLL